MIPLKVALPILCLAISFSIISSFYPPPATSQEEHPCLHFANHEGTLAVLNMGMSNGYGDRFNTCAGFEETLDWFKSKGYHISAVNSWEMFLER